MYKSLLAMLLCTLIYHSNYAQSKSNKIESFKLTVQKMKNEFVILDFHFEDSTKLKVIKLENTRALHRLKLEDQTKVYGIFMIKSFASAGGLGSTRVAKGEYQIIEVISKDGKTIKCPPLCKEKVPLSLSISGF